MKTIVNILISAIAVIFGAYLIPGIEISGFFTAVVVAIVIAVINTIIKPILVVLTIPITVVTLGLFLLVINAAMIKLAGFLVPGFVVNGFLSALILSFILSLINWIFANKDK